MLYEDKTALIRRGLFDVQNEIGLGRSEDIYHQAFCHWLLRFDIPHTSKAAHPLELAGDTVHVFYPDFVLWNCITVELKAIPRRLREEDRVQLFNYLKCRGDNLGLLVNMGLDRVHVERFVFELPDSSINKSSDLWDESRWSESPEIAFRIRQALIRIYEEHGTGYGMEVLDKLLLSSLSQNELKYSTNPSAVSSFMGKEIGHSPLHCLLIEKQALLVHTALFDDNEFNVRRGLSFMKALGIKWCLAVNYGKKALETNVLHNND